LVLLNFIRSLRVIAVLSFFGNIFMFYAFAVVLQYLIRTMPYSLADLPWIGSMNGMVLAAGTIIYSFEGQAMVLPLENRLTNPKKMRGLFGIISVGMAVIVVMFNLLGVMAMLTYGTDFEGSIAFKLPPGTIYVLVKAAVSLAAFNMYVLQMYVIADMTWPAIEQRVSTAMAMPANLLMRTLLVVVTFLIAAAIPNLSQIIPLVGITTGMLLALILPAMLDVFTFVPVMRKELRDYPSYSIRWRLATKLAKNGFLAAIGVFGLVVGLQSSIANIINGKVD